MSGSAIPDDVAQFIREHIHSVEQLEVLLLLRSAGGEWSGESVAREMRISPLSASARLHDLEQRRLVRRGGSRDTYVYDPPDPSLRAVIDQLTTTYAQAKYTVINFIFSKPDESLKSFADAFRLKKGDR